MVESLDRLGLVGNASLIKTIQKQAGSDVDVTIVFSAKVLKLNKRGQEQPRFMIITQDAVYNFKELSKYRRRIALVSIASLSISTLSNEMILHVPSEYDYKYKTDFKHEIAELLAVLIRKKLGKDLVVNYVDKAGLLRTSIKHHRRISSHSTSFSDARVGRAKRSGSVSEDSKLDEEWLGSHPLLENSEKVTCDDFEQLRVLGKGAFGKVLHVRKIDTGKEYAMKVLKKAHLLQTQTIESTLLERNILAAFRNPFVMSLRFAFQTRDKLYLVMDLYDGGELLGHLERKKKFTEDEARIIIAEIVVAIGHLHSLNFIYRDLKPENILMDQDGHIVLTDFGLAKQLDPCNPEAHSFVGTPHYIAPELLLQQPHGPPVDWWSLGVVLYELVVGIPPWHDESVTEIFAKITSKPVPLPSYLSTECKALIAGVNLSCWIESELT